MNRREMLELSAAAVGVARLSPIADGPWPIARPIDEVRIGFVGVGGQGTTHVENLVRIPGAKITAVCDIVEAHAERSAKIITDAGQPRPTLYTRGPTDFLRLCESEQLDLVFTATPWEWHVPVLLSAARHGKHAVTEVPAAMSKQAGGVVATEASGQGGASEKQRPMVRSYAVTVATPNPDARLVAGLRGTLRIDSEPRCLFWRIKRYAQQTFNFRM